MVQVGMCNEDSADDFPKDMRCVGFCCLVRQLQAFEWAFLHRSLVILRPGDVPTE